MNIKNISKELNKLPNEQFNKSIEYLIKEYVNNNLDNYNDDDFKQLINTKLSKIINIQTIDIRPNTHDTLEIYLRLTKEVVNWKNNLLLKFQKKNNLSDKEMEQYEVHHTQSFAKILYDTLIELNLPKYKKISSYKQSELIKIRENFISRHNTILGIVIDKKLHKEFHMIYGYFMFTYEDYNNFLLYKQNKFSLNIKTVQKQKLKETKDYKTSISKLIYIEYIEHPQSNKSIENDGRRKPLFKKTNELIDYLNSILKYQHKISKKHIFEMPSIHINNSHTLSNVFKTNKFQEYIKKHKIKITNNSLEW